MNRIDSLGIYVNGEFVGVNNEFSMELIETAINKGVEINAGRKEAIAIVFGSIWLDGYIVGCGATDENVIRTLKESIQKYFFV